MQSERREIREYKAQMPLEVRCQKVAELKTERAGHCPIILLKARGCRYLPPPQKCLLCRYNVDSGLTMGTFLYTIRRQMKLSKSDGLYMYVGEMLPVLSSTIGEIYKTHSDADGFLYIVFSHEVDKG